MAIDSTSPRTRRAILGAALGAGVATIASAVGQPLRADAADGQAVLVGGEYTASSVTKISQTADSTQAIWGASGAGTGVFGQSASSYGVHGQSTSGIGIVGDSTSNSGIFGASHSATWSAIIGTSAGNSTGVYGASGGIAPGAPAKTGVYGYAAQDSSARGVHGQSTAGRGIYGQATSGYGVRGYATSGTAGYFASAAPTSGTALRAVGRVKLDKCVGVATIAKNTKSVTVTPGIDVVSTAAVVATLQGNPGGTTTVQRVSISPTANTFTIYLTANSTATVKVAWHIFG